MGKLRLQGGGGGSYRLWVIRELFPYVLYLYILAGGGMGVELQDILVWKMTSQPNLKIVAGVVVGVVTGSNLPV